MIVIHICDDDNHVLGTVTIDNDFVVARTGKLNAEWIGDAIIAELPSDDDALKELLK